MKGMIDFELPFPWCAKCVALDPEIVKYYADCKAKTIRRCKNADICTAADKARKEQHLGSIFVRDPKHGIVEHTVNQIVTIYYTDAKAPDGETWADQFTEEEIKAGILYGDPEAAAVAAERKKIDQSRA